jgi:hypothetical protein
MLFGLPADLGFRCDAALGTLGQLSSFLIGHVFLCCSVVRKESFDGIRSSSLVELCDSS